MLLNDDASNSFLSLVEMQCKYSLNFCPLKYLGLISALKSLWNKCKDDRSNNCNYDSNFVEKLTK